MPVVDESLYSRQSNLTLIDYDVCVVIGCGGIGNWVAMDLALSGKIGEIILIDPDIVEESNLNRTFFDYTDIGNYKVNAVAKHIELRRPQQKIVIITEYMNKCLANSFIKKYFDDDNTYYHKKFCIVDCRDDIYDDCYELKCKLYKVGYDGMSITIDGNPRLTKVFGQRGGSYTVTPSYIGSAQLSAIFVCNDILYPKICHILDMDKKMSIGEKLSKIESIRNFCENSEDYPYLEKRAGYEYDELGRLNDVVNMNCCDIVCNMVYEKHDYVIPNQTFENLPNL